MQFFQLEMANSNYIHFFIKICSALMNNIHPLGVVYLRFISPTPTPTQRSSIRVCQTPVHHTFVGCLVIVHHSFLGCLIPNTTILTCQVQHSVVSLSFLQHNKTLNILIHIYDKACKVRTPRTNIDMKPTPIKILYNRYTRSTRVYTSWTSNIGVDFRSPTNQTSSP